MADYGGIGGGSSLRDALNQLYPLTNLGGVSTGFPPQGAPEQVPLPQPNQRRINDMESGLVNQYARQIGKPSHQWSPQDVANFQALRATQGAETGGIGVPLPQPRPPIPPGPIGAAPPNPQDDSAQMQRQPMPKLMMELQQGQQGPPNYAAQLGLTRPY